MSVTAKLLTQRAVVLAAALAGGWGAKRTFRTGFGSDDPGEEKDPFASARSIAANSLCQVVTATAKWLENADDAEWCLEEAGDLIENDIGFYPPALLDLLLRLTPTGSSRIAVLAQLIAALAEHDLPLAMRETERAVPDPETRATCYLDNADRLHSDPGLAWEVLSRVEPGATGDRWNKLPDPMAIWPRNAGSSSGRTANRWRQRRMSRRCRRVPCGKRPSPTRRQPGSASTRPVPGPGLAPWPRDHFDKLSGLPAYPPVTHPANYPSPRT